MALLGALARTSRNPVAYGVAGFYVSFFRGTPLIVQMFLLYLALPPVGRNLAEKYSWLPGGLRRPAPAGHRDRRHHRARPQLRRVHDRDLPVRHPVGGRRTGRGCGRTRDEVRPEDAPRRAAAGVPGRHPADRQRVHRDDEGHGAGLVPGRHPRQRRGLPPGPAGRQGGLQEPRGVRRGGARLLGADGAVHLLPGAAREADRSWVRPGPRRAAMWRQRAGSAARQGAAR